MTLFRWTRTVMNEVSIDTSMFRPYTTCILKGWLNLENGELFTSTFFSHYLRKVKYFSRETATSAHSKSTAYIRLIPASPIRRAASFSLKKSLQCTRDRIIIAPMINSSILHQGYLPLQSPTLSISTVVSSIQVFDKLGERWQDVLELLNRIVG